MAKLLTKGDITKLTANGKKAAASGDFTCKPVVKLFGGGAATWLLCWVEADGDRAFGLCDLGMGEPELGYVSLNELRALRFRPFGLGVERDRYWTATKDINEYARDAWSKGRIAA